MDLTDLERIALAGLSAREREILDQYVAPWRQDHQTVLRSIEDRLALPAGALGTTHAITDNQVVALEAADAQTR